MQKPTVFISYSRQDSYFANLVAQGIAEQTQYEVWLDIHSISPAEDWMDRIDAGIDNSFALILILSPDSVKSQYVIYEWSYALGKELTVIPIEYRKIDNPEAVHRRLRNDQFIKCYEPKHLDWSILYGVLDKAHKDYQQKRHNQIQFYDIEGIRKVLQSDNVESILSALEAVKRSENENLYQDVQPLLVHSDAKVRANAFEASYILSLDKTIPHIMRAIKSESSPVVLHFLAGICRNLLINRPHLIDELIIEARGKNGVYLFDNEVPINRIFSVHILEGLVLQSKREDAEDLVSSENYDKIVDLFVDLLEDDSPHVLINAVAAIGNLSRQTPRSLASVERIDAIRETDGNKLGLYLADFSEEFGDFKSLDWHTTNTLSIVRADRDKGDWRYTVRKVRA